MLRSSSNPGRTSRAGGRPGWVAGAVLLVALVSVQCTPGSATRSSVPTSGSGSSDAPAAQVVAAEVVGSTVAPSRSAVSPRVSLRLRQHRVSTTGRARAKVVLHPPRFASLAERRSLRAAPIKVRLHGPGTTRVLRTHVSARRTVVSLPRLRKGVYRVRAVFPGNRLLHRSVSHVRTLTVVKSAVIAPPQPPSGWPDGSNTGVPPGTTLTPYGGSCTITSPVVIDSKTIDCPGGVGIKAAGVVIRNSMVKGRIVIDTDLDRSWSLSLTDSEVDAGDGDLPAINNGNVVIERANIHGGHNGLECQEHSSYCVLRDSWIHDQWQAPSGDTHLGGFLALGVQVPCRGTNGACVELVHNSIVCDAPVNVDGGGCTGDINLIPHFGPLPSALIENNFLGANTGSAACTFGGAGVEYPATNIIYRDNVFQRGTNKKCAAYGPVAFFDPASAGNVWTGNHYEDGVAILCDARHDCM